VDIAVRNVSPDRIVESVLLEHVTKQLKTVFELFETDDHIGRRLLDGWRVLLSRANPTVDRFGHCFANGQQLSLTPTIRWERDFCAVEKFSLRNQPAQADQWRVRRTGTQRVFDLAVGVLVR